MELNSKLNNLEDDDVVVDNASDIDCSPKSPHIIGIQTTTYESVSYSHNIQPTRSDCHRFPEGRACISARVISNQCVPKED